MTRPTFLEISSEGVGSEAMPERFDPIDHQGRYLVTISSEQLRIALNIDLFQFVQLGTVSFRHLFLHPFTKVATRFAVDNNLRSRVIAALLESALREPGGEGVGAASLPSILLPTLSQSMYNFALLRQFITFFRRGALLVNQRAIYFAEIPESLCRGGLYSRFNPSKGSCNC